MTRCPAVFVSFSQDEAKEKILVARQVYEDLPSGAKKKLIVDSKTELAFVSNGGNATLNWPHFEAF